MGLFLLSPDVFMASKLIRVNVFIMHRVNIGKCTPALRRDSVETPCRGNHLSEQNR